MSREQVIVERLAHTVDVVLCSVLVEVGRREWHLLTKDCWLTTDKISVNNG